MVKSIPNDKILDLSELKAIADNKINVTQKWNSLSAFSSFLIFSQHYFLRIIKRLERLVKSQN